MQMDYLADIKNYHAAVDMRSPAYGYIIYSGKSI